MKRNKVTLAVLLAALSFFAAPSAHAISQSDLLTIKKAVADVPAAELAAKAGQIVSQASTQDRQDVALATVREIVAKRPAVLVAAVAAIAKAAPEISPAVAAEAAKLSKDQAAEIAKAAATSAPSKSQQIAAAVAQVTPSSATKVTREVASLVPEQTTKIVETVVASVPSAQASLAADPVLTRLSRSSASTGGGNGIITTRQGTIRGVNPPETPPTSAGTPTQGSDPRRGYGSPSQ